MKSLCEKYLEKIYSPTLHMNMMVINMQVNAIYIIIDIWHDMISAHISDVPIFIPCNRMFIVLKIGTVYVTSWWLLFWNITIRRALWMLHLPKMSQWEQYTKQKLYEEAFNVSFNWQKYLSPKCFKFHDLTCREINSPISL